VTSNLEDASRSLPLPEGHFSKAHQQSMSLYKNQRLNIAGMDRNRRPTSSAWVDTMTVMIGPCIKPSAFWCRQPSADLFVQDNRKAKLGRFIANLVAMDELIDFAVIARPKSGLPARARTAAREHLQNNRPEPCMK
jgi:hypothetical protein